jgi:hypothetical protein
MAFDGDWPYRVCCKNAAGKFRIKDAVQADGLQGGWNMRFEPALSERIPTRTGCEELRIAREIKKALAQYTKALFKSTNFLAPRPGLEPGTCGLTVRRSTN